MADEPVINRNTLSSQRVTHFTIIDGQEVIQISKPGEGGEEPGFCYGPSPYGSPCCPDETCDCHPLLHGCVVGWAFPCIGMDGYCYYYLDEGVECDPVEGCWCTYHYAGNDCVPW